MVVRRTEIRWSNQSVVVCSSAATTSTQFVWIIPGRRGRHRYCDRRFPPDSVLGISDRAACQSLRVANPSSDSPGQSVLPPGVSIEDGLTADDVVQVALWNNAMFQATLVPLGVSSAQLLDAGLIADPQFQILFPFAPQHHEFTTFQAVDVRCPLPWVI